MTDINAPNPAPGANTAPNNPGDTTQPPAGGTPPAAAATPPAGGGQAAWWEGKITEPEVVDFMKAKNYQTPEDAARAAWSANKMMKLEPAIQAFVEGKATPEQEAAVFNRLGRPESGDKYELKPGEGIQVDPGLDKLARGLFHDAGLNQKQADKMFQGWNKAVAEMNAATMAAESAANEAAVSELEKSYGADLAKNKAAGLRVMQSLGLNEQQMDAIQKNIGAAPLIDLMVRIGLKSSEGNFQGGNGGGGDPNNVSGMSKEQAAARIAQLQIDTDFQAKLKDTSNPEARKAALTLWEQLHAKAG